MPSYGGAVNKWTSVPSKLEPSRQGRDWIDSQDRYCRTKAVLEDFPTEQPIGDHPTDFLTFPNGIVRSAVLWIHLGH